MPHFYLETNLPKDKIPADFFKQTISIMAKTLEKPESYCVASVVPDVLFSWGGTNEPCGIATLSAIGKIGVEENKRHAAPLFDHVEKSLGIPRTRMYITFTNLDAANVGYNGTTFHESYNELFGKK